MAVTIKAAKPKNLQAVLSKTKNDAMKYCFAFEGNGKHGHGSGSGFDGSYTVDRGIVTVCVLKKPAFVTKTGIEKIIRKYLAQNKY